MKIQRLVHASSPESEDPLLKIDANGVPKPRARPRHKSHVLIACRSCQERKCRCDGSRPTCRGCAKRGVACTYDGADGLTRMAILKNRNRELADKLAAYERFFQLLCTASDPDAQELLRNVRVSSDGDVSAVLYGFRDRFGDAATIGVLSGNGSGSRSRSSGNSRNGQAGSGSGIGNGEDDGGDGRHVSVGGNGDGYDDDTNNNHEYGQRVSPAGDSVVAETAMMAMMGGEEQEESMTAAAAVVTAAAGGSLMNINGHEADMAAAAAINAAIMPNLGEPMAAALNISAPEGGSTALTPPRLMTAASHGANGIQVGAEQGLS